MPEGVDVAWERGRPVTDHELEELKSVSSKS
jgi:hypothetical protein